MMMMKEGGGGRRRRSIGDQGDDDDDAMIATDENGLVVGRVAKRRVQVGRNEGEMGSRLSATG